MGAHKERPSLEIRVTRQHRVCRFTHAQQRMCRLRARQTRKDLAFMELIVSSMIAALLLLVGHLGVLVHKRFVRAR